MLYVKADIFLAVLHIKEKGPSFFLEVVSQYWWNVSKKYVCIRANFVRYYKLLSFSIYLQRAGSCSTK